MYRRYISSSYMGAVEDIHEELQSITKEIQQVISRAKNDEVLAGDWDGNPFAETLNSFIQDLEEAYHEIDLAMDYTGAITAKEGRT